MIFYLRTLRYHLAPSSGNKISQKKSQLEDMVSPLDLITIVVTLEWKKAE